MFQIWIMIFAWWVKNSNVCIWSHF